MIIAFTDYLHTHDHLMYDDPMVKTRGLMLARAQALCNKINDPTASNDQIQQYFFELIQQEYDPSFHLVPPFYTDCGLNISVGKHVFINTGATFQDQGGITIGNNVLIGHHATILTLNHGLTIASRHDYFFKPVIIEDDVWLGANVTVLPGVTIGKGSVVGAGSIVTKDVPPHTVVVGSPAHVVKTIE